MARLEDLKPGVSARGISPAGLATVVSAKWYGSDNIEVFYSDAEGRAGNRILGRADEPDIEIASIQQGYPFDADGEHFRIVAEAQRISMAFLFDPRLAVHTSMIEALPHQITAVYEAMLPRHPLRFLLADDPGAGKTIMAGLFIKELLIRGALERCLVVCPGNLVDQWQEELFTKFKLNFGIVGRADIENAASGNPFKEKDLLITRLDLMSRFEEVQQLVAQTDGRMWDLIVVDEAHKMSASYIGNEVKKTKRFRLGEFLGGLTRNLLLMTATPHNGKETDYQLFLSLIDADRFEGKYREGEHEKSAMDIMRRVTKEGLRKFDGSPLFPERFAYSVSYNLSDLEKQLYDLVTTYVREEMNRADRLSAEGEKRRGNTVGFALTVLQRRLASSPEAIYMSLKRRHERLEKRLKEEMEHKYSAETPIDTTMGLPDLDDEAVDDLDDAPSEEIEEAEEEVVDQASAARTIAELQAEIATLARLEEHALKVRRSKTDKKWEELSSLLQGKSEVLSQDGKLRKLIIFTEHRDTMSYLLDRLGTLIGRPEAIVAIHGGLSREERKRAEAAFKQDKDVQLLVATDAAGEGINLQRAHLMVNYDLPWNPNRIEQRFGRIHRIGQTEVCYLWNMVAHDTREGDVYEHLLKKLAEQRSALGGKVFDVLGKMFREKSLRELLIEAIRYGESPEVRSRIFGTVDGAFDREHIEQLLAENALAAETLDPMAIRRIREDMERAEAQRLQPHFVAEFFMAAFKLLGGRIEKREDRRYEIKRVPEAIRNERVKTSLYQPILHQYERVTFHKDLINVEGKPQAEFLSPGHSLLTATISVLNKQYASLLKQGAILVDTREAADTVRLLFFVEHTIKDAVVDKDGRQRDASRRMCFIEMDETGSMMMAGDAPYLDYRPLGTPTDAEKGYLDGLLASPWLKGDVEEQVKAFAIATVVDRHYAEVRTYREEMVARTMAAVKARLTREISLWDRKSQELKAQETAGKPEKRISSAKAAELANTLHGRLQKRIELLENERRLSKMPPVITGIALVIPETLLKQGGRVSGAPPPMFAHETKHSEELSMKAVMDKERQDGREPVDVSKDKRGYDIESRDPQGGPLRFIEVKGRVEGARTVTITKSEILTALNKPDAFLLAIVEVVGESTKAPVYIRQPFQKEPDFGVTSVNYNITELLSRADRAA